MSDRIDVSDSFDVVAEIARRAACSVERLTRPPGERCDAELVDDLFQEAFLRICVKRSKLDVSYSSFEQLGYLRKIARSAAIDFIRCVTNRYRSSRSAKQFVGRDDDREYDASERAAPVASDEREICVDIVARFQKKLNDDDRKFLMKILDGKSFAGEEENRRKRLVRRLKRFAQAVKNEYRT